MDNRVTFDLPDRPAPVTAIYVGADHLRVTLTAKATGAVCMIDLRRNGDRLTVSESGDCAVWHGAACPFAGVAARVK